MGLISASRVTAWQNSREHSNRTMLRRATRPRVTRALTRRQFKEPAPPACSSPCFVRMVVQPVLTQGCAAILSMSGRTSPRSRARHAGHSLIQRTVGSCGDCPHVILDSSRTLTFTPCRVASHRIFDVRASLATGPRSTRAITWKSFKELALCFCGVGLHAIFYYQANLTFRPWLRGQSQHWRV
jgi:hypothetical protein